jgi:cytochrome P450
MVDSTVTDIDLSDPALFVDAVPHAAFAQLRREDPVHFNPEVSGPGFWAVTRYEDIRAVHRDAETFSSEIGGTSLEDLDQEQIEARKSMIDTDPPRHEELRAMVGRRFTPRTISDWEDHVRIVVREVLDRALSLGEFDFVEEVAAEIPARVIAEFLGVPQDQRQEIIHLSSSVVGRQDPEYVTELDDESRLLPGSSPASRLLIGIGRRIADERRRSPADDLISQLAFEGGLSQREFDVYFVLLAIGGNETTRHTLSHGLAALLERPEQLERLRRDPQLFATAPDELLRWATPIHHLRRTAARDVELGGRQISAGDKVTTWFVSGNRDEQVFPEANVFDISRSPNPHMAFGPGGVHHCLGSHLARLEIRVAFEEFLSRGVDLELVGAPERLRSNFFNGIKRMYVRTI